MSAFNFLPLLEFTFEGGAHSRQGADFFKLLFYNLFVAEPPEAVLDIMEVNFGFQFQGNENNTQIIPLSKILAKGDVDSPGNTPIMKSSQNPDNPSQE